MHVREPRHDLRQVVDRLVAGVELDVGGVVVDLDRVAPDLLHERDRHVARGHDVAVDLERDDDARRVGRVRELADVGEEGCLVLVRRLVPADCGVHDRDAVVGRPAHGPDPVLEALGRRQVGVAGEADRGEAVARRACAARRPGISKDRRAPSTREQPSVRRGGSPAPAMPGQRLVEAVGVVRVRVPGQRVLHRRLP